MRQQPYSSLREAPAAGLTCTTGSVVFLFSRIQKPGRVPQVVDSDHRPQDQLSRIYRPIDRDLAGQPARAALMVTFTSLG